MIRNTYNTYVLSIYIESYSYRTLQQISTVQLSLFNASVFSELQILASTFNNSRGLWYRADEEKVAAAFEVQ